MTVIDPAQAAHQVQLNLDHVWTLVAASMVFLMQAGFMLLELGSTRAKNAINIVMKNTLDFCVSSIGFYLVGFGLMFGATAGGWIGLSHFMNGDAGAQSPLWGFWLFQLVFAGTAATIVSGAMAERTKFVGYLIYSAGISILIYPVFGHWAWGGLFIETAGSGTGWLAKLGYIDFAGSGVVHMIGGVCALAGILVVGPRLGKYAPDGTPRMIVGHNMPMVALGTLLLWFCWFGFNAGSTLKGDVTIGRIAVNTSLAGAIAALSAMLSMWRVQGRPDVAITLNGALSGLVAITAGCHVVTPNSALLIGLIAGLLTTYSSLWLEKRRIDDAVGAVPVHLVGGVWGVLAVALFHEAGFSLDLLLAQLAGIGAGCTWAFVTSFILFKTVQKTVGLRASDIEQSEGLDFHEHSAAAYPEFATNDQKLD